MSVSSLKQLVVYGILLAVLSQSVCNADRDRSYIKTNDGPRQSRPTSVDVVTTISPDGETRKLVTGELRCLLWQNCMMHEDPNPLTPTRSSHRWECAFDSPGINPNIESFGGDENKLIVIEGYDNVNAFMEDNTAVSGDSVLIMTSPNITTDRVVVHVDDVIGIEALNSTDSVDGGLRKPPKTNRRKLVKKEGNLIAVVVRVSAIDTTPTANATQLSSDIFGDDACLKTQYEQCSYGKLKITAYNASDGSGYDVPTAAPGVVEISVNINATGTTSGTVQVAANEELRKVFGGNVAKIDLILFIFPGGIEPNFLAYAYINGKDSYYSDKWGQTLSAPMHEVGHSLGLHHSGEYDGNSADQEYGDQVGYMGFSFRFDDTPLMCFNPAKNWQLGWYSDKHVDVNPDELFNDSPTNYTLNGVVDYEDGVGDVVLKIGNFYLGYNKAADFNFGTEEARNRIVVNEKISSRSKLAAILDIGEFSTIAITAQLEVKVKYVRFENNKDAVIELTVVGEPPQCQGPSNKVIDIEFTTDRFPGESSWTVVDAIGRVVGRSEDYTDKEFEYNPTVIDLCAGLEYYFVIVDSYGDGTCCAYGPGAFVGKYGEMELFRGDGDFGDGVTIPFTIPTPTPTPEPTSASTEAPTSSPTTAPTTKAPTNAIITNSDCVDDENFMYRNKSKRKCTWVSGLNNPISRRRACNRRAMSNTDSTRVWGYCKETCYDAGFTLACS